MTANKQSQIRVNAFFITIFMLWSIALNAFAQEDAKGIRIHRTGKFAGKNVTACDGESWFGLFPTENGFELKQCKVRVVPFRDFCMGDTEEEKTGREVCVEGEVEPLFLIHGMDTLQEGDVETCIKLEKPHNSGIFLFPGQHLSARLPIPGKSAGATRLYALVALGEAVEADPGLGYAVMRHYQIVLNRTQAAAQELTGSQILREYAEFDLEGPPKLIWAGDLDRDGQLDVFMNTYHEYAAREYTLFLSSMAEMGELVKEVASYLVPSC